MKKLISLLSVFFLSTAGYAANKIEMVTYFPVPYVAYSRVQVDKILDIGLTNVCNMSLGCTESGNAGLRPLHVQDAYLETGSLDLTRALAVRSNNVSLGANAGEANIDFNDSLRIKNLNDGYSLETSQLTVDALKLFPNRIVNNFPSCAATGADGAPQVSWQKLKIKDKEETFLVCGTPQQVDCSNADYRKDHKSECCPQMPVSDSVCYKDCYGVSWGPLGGTVETVLGSDWIARSCSRKAENGSHRRCSGEAGDWDALYGEYACWKSTAYALTKGFTFAIYGTGTGFSNCVEQLPIACVEESDAGQTCIVFDGDAWITCEWKTGGGLVSATYNGGVGMWKCQIDTSIVTRCKNGW